MSSGWPMPLRATSRSTGDTAILDEQAALHRRAAAQPTASMTPSSRRRSPRRRRRSTSTAPGRSTSPSSAPAENGLPLILGGDWNDGMNRVGEGGKGDSVWLGWFLLQTLSDFAPIAPRPRAIPSARQAWDKHAECAQAGAGESPPGTAHGIAAAASTTARRSARAARDECKIDSIAQSWSVLSGEGDPARSRTAMEQATKMLVDDELGDRQAVHAALRQDGEGPRLHQGLSAGRARERRPVHPCGDMVRHRAGRDGTRRRRLSLLLDAQPGQSCARREGRRASIGSSPMSWRPMSMPTPSRRDAAAGPGTPVRPAGSIGPPSRPSSA